MKRGLFVIPLFAMLLNGQSLSDCRQLHHHGKYDEARACYGALTRSSNDATRAEGFWGLQQYDEANNAFRAALKAHPDSAAIRVRWGRLLLERFNTGDAAELFQEALKTDPGNSDAYVGLARVAAENFDKKAVEFADKALEIDPKNIEAEEILASVALEDDDQKLAAKEAQKALVISPESL
ncbi:MAG: tetratricopeptide repeat protein, partial [Bryobacteraceae bacterium]